MAREISICSGHCMIYKHPVHQIRKQRIGELLHNTWTLFTLRSDTVHVRDICITNAKTCHSNRVCCMMNAAFKSSLQNWAANEQYFRSQVFSYLFILVVIYLLIYLLIFAYADWLLLARFTYLTCTFWFMATLIMVDPSNTMTNRAKTGTS